MSDQSRLFIAAVLMMGVLLISWFVTGKSNNQPAPVAVVESVTEEPVIEMVPVEETEEVEDSPQGEELESDYQEETVTVLIPDDSGEIIVTAVISTTGGAVVSWELEQYEDYPDQNLDRVVQLAMEPWMISREAGGEQVLFNYNGPDTVSMYPDENSLMILMETADGAVKEFSFERNYYGFTVNSQGTDINASVSHGAITETETNPQERGYFSASWYTNGHKKEEATKIEGLEPVGNVSWVASSNKYFTIVLIPQSMVRADGYIAPGEGGSPEVSIDDSSVKVYAGPKSYSLLSDLGGSQTDMIDFGWPVIRWIGKLIFLYLTKILAFASNWGVRIIILAATLKLILSPLTAKSYVSMQKMQKVQPALQEIQKKYSSDPKRQQVEMQKFYKESGVNPLGGCLPILFQMPVFLAMYRVLANMVELRGQGFMLWITDLSRPEILLPFGTKIMGLEGIGLLSLILGLLMFLQQRLTATSGSGSSAQQQKMMMYMMPFFMMFLFMRFASGLTLYYLVFNIFTFVQQEMIKKNMTKGTVADGKAV